MNSLAKFALQYKTSSNSVEQFLLRQKRQEFLAGQIKERVFTEWIGRIKTLRTTKNGKADRVGYRLGQYAHKDT